MHGPEKRVCAGQGGRAQLLEVHADVARLVEVGLIERTDDDRVNVLFDAVEILMAWVQAA